MSIFDEEQESSEIVTSFGDVSELAHLEMEIFACHPTGACRQGPICAGAASRTTHAVTSLLPAGQNGIV